ncbi:hypothetical protein [Streptomyces aureocirculatus]|uniref:hypothetical protein n=1 Tax=Streptomyces aureocirculatus TaxID=67275 RepID=UPI0012FF3148|nr:hypothetical protein [Streptomyces aureocirculatus]
MTLKSVLGDIKRTCARSSSLRAGSRQGTAPHHLTDLLVGTAANALGTPGAAPSHSALETIESDVREIKDDLSDVKRLLAALVQAQGIDRGNA